jgi:hypothetical protein
MSWRKREEHKLENQVMFSWAGVELSTLLLRPLSCLLYQPWMMTNDDECGAGGGMLGRGNGSSRRKPVPVPLCPPQIAHNLTWTLNRAAAMEAGD